MKSLLLSDKNIQLHIIWVYIRLFVDDNRLENIMMFLVMLIQVNICFIILYLCSSVLKPRVHKHLGTNMSSNWVSHCWRKDERPEESSSGWALAGIGKAYQPSINEEQTLSLAFGFEIISPWILINTFRIWKFQINIDIRFGRFMFEQRNVAGRTDFKINKRHFTL